MNKLAAALAVMFAAASPALAQPAPPAEPSITVQGQGRVQAKPDYAALTAEVLGRGASLQAATAAHRESLQRATQALQRLQASGVQIERSTFRLDEERRPPAPGQPRDASEFRAVTSYELKATQLDKLDAAIAEIAATGVFELRGLRFAIDERNPAIDAARRAAVEDARRRAETYTQAANVQLGSILRIADTEAHMPREVMAAPMMRSSVGVNPPEALTVTSNVTMTWKIGGP